MSAVRKLPMSHNKDLKKKLQEYEIPKREFFSFETSEGVKLNACDETIKL
jgi:hypothetical protein